MKKNMPMSVKRFNLFFLAFLAIPFSVFCQAADQAEVTYYLGFDFNEGIYKTIDDFRANKPAYETKMERVGAELYIEDDSSKEMILVDPDRIWGFCLANNIYISYDQAYWRLISIGTLSHFTAIVISTFQTIDAFGFPVTQHSKSLQHLFVDVRSGEIYALTEEQLEPFMHEEPILQHRFERTKRKKMNDLIQGLKDYNEIFPIEFPVYD